MRPSVEALPGDSNAAVTVVSTDAANENMSNQEIDVRKLIASDHRNQPQQPHNSVIVLFVGVDKSQ